MKKIFLFLLLWINATYATTPKEKLKEMGIELALPTTSSVGSFAPVRCAGNMIYVSGHISRKDGKVMEGKLGKDVTLEDGISFAKLIAIDLLGTLNNYVKDINQIRFVKVVSFVNSDPSFTRQHLVTNGASDLFIEVFGENGKHARSAVGVASLPLNAAVEIELVLESLNGKNICK